jgi:hypothetical protein
MPSTDDQLGELLAPEESVVAASTGTLTEASLRYPVSIVLTDRRLLCLSEGGRLVTVGYDSICTVRSYSRTTRTYRFADHRLPQGAGGLGALLGGAGVFALTTGVLVPLLALVTVGGLVVGEYARRQADTLGLETVTAVRRHVPSRGGGTSIRRWSGRSVPDAIDEPRALLLGSVVAAVVSFVGLLVLTPGWLVVLSVVVLAGGLALVDYGVRHEDGLDGLELVRQRKLDVRIGTGDDRIISLRIDPSEEFIQQLSRVAFTDDAEPVQPVLSRS